MFHQCRVDFILIGSLLSAVRGPGVRMRGWDLSKYIQPAEKRHPPSTHRAFSRQSHLLHQEVRGSTDLLHKPRSACVYLPPTCNLAHGCKERYPPTYPSEEGLPWLLAGTYYILWSCAQPFGRGGSYFGDFMVFWVLITCATSIFSLNVTETERAKNFS